MTAAALEAAGGVTFDAIEAHRPALTGFCYRMLGSAFDADDAVQETVVRAWQGSDRFEGRAPLEAWLFRIATNVCLSMLRGRQRRARPVDLGPASPASATLGEPRAAEAWIGPIPDRRAGIVADDPAELAISRESIRLAFVAALQLLPPRQRAVLILRDVLRWRAGEVADLLGASVVSVKSALQRARATLAAHPVAPAGTVDDETARELLDLYVDAFERYDVDTLVSLLRDDATLSMPPYELWLRGPGGIREWWLREAPACHDSVTVPVAANGSHGFAQYRPAGADGGHQPFAIHVIETDGCHISAIDVFVDGGLFALFGVPDRLDAPG